MKAILSVTLVFVLLIISIGCGKGKSPTDPGFIQRQNEGFATPTEIFEPEDALIDSDGFHEVDLARILTGWTSGLTPDSECWYGGYTTAVVTLQRGENAGDPFKPVIRFLQGNETGNPVNGTFSDVHWVTEWDYDNNGDHQAEYRHPKCDAVMFQAGITTIIEIAVVYQVHGLTEAEVDEILMPDFFDVLQSETNDGANDWDIGGTILRWNANNFPNGEPERTDFLIPDTGFSSQNPDSDPDVAYDRSTGDCYIVYSKAETPLGVEKSTIKYVYLDRDQDPPYYLTGEAIFDYTHGGWRIGWPRNVQLNENHNGHTPSIAIGLLDFFIHDPDSHHWVENTRWICIAYTSQFDNHMGYHVIAGGWQLVTGGYDNRVFLPIRHPVYGELDAGFPCIAVTPSASCQRNFAALVLTQQVDTDGYGPILKNFEVDLFGLRWVSSPSPSHWEVQEWYEVPTPSGNADCLYPSIALHENWGSETGPFYASITFMAQEPYQDILYPAVSDLELNLTIIDDDDLGPPYLETSKSYSVTQKIEDSGQISGNYNISQVPFIDPGVTTAIVSGSGRYWAAWNERIEMEPPPAYVYGTYGYIGD